MSVGILLYDSANTALPLIEIELDASLEENHTYTSKVTQFPIETGATISDFVYNEPIKVSIQGFITNNPLNNEQDSLRVNTAFVNLLKIRDSRATVDLITGLTIYSNMVMQSLSIPRNAKIGDTLHFTADFIQIQTVASSEIPVSSLKESGSFTTGTIPKTAAKQESIGSQTPTEVAPAEQKNHNSWARQLFLWGAGAPTNDTTIMQVR